MLVGALKRRLESNLSLNATRFRRLNAFHPLRVLLVIVVALFFSMLVPTLSSAQRDGASDSDSTGIKRLGIWNFKEGYISQIDFRDDLNLNLYLVNPEGAAIWELNLAGPSKRKTVPSTFFENLAPSISWFTNANLAYSQSSNLLLMWPGSPDQQSPPCLLFRFEAGEIKESLSLDLPHGYIVRFADFSSDDRLLAISKHPSSEQGGEVLFFDLAKPRVLGELKSLTFRFTSLLGLVNGLKFQPWDSDIWLSVGMFNGTSYSPPLLVRISPGRDDDLPLIQGSLMPDGLIPSSDSVSILLDSRQALGKAGIDPNNWWVISYAEKTARRPCSLKGEFSRICDLGGGRIAALFKPRSGGGVLGDSRLILLNGNEYLTLATGVRLADCSPSGRLVAVVFRSSNRLEVFALPDSSNPGESPE